MRCLQLAAVLLSSGHGLLILSLMFEIIHFVNRAGESASLSAAFLANACLHSTGAQNYKKLYHLTAPESPNSSLEQEL